MADEYDQAQALLQNQNDLLNEALAIGYENEQIGVETDIMLKQQREQLTGVTEKLSDIDSNLDSADSKLRRMTVRIFGDKIVQFLIIICLVIIILAIVFFKWILPLITK